MLKKLKFYALGLIPGLIIVFFVFNRKGAKCTGYLPNSRVIAETLSKDFEFSPEFSAQMKTLQIDEKFLKDSIISAGEIDFKRSKAQQEPCPEYLISYPEKNPRFEVHFTKCKEKVTFNEMKKVK
ncbi:MAG: hypothetical protein CSA38_01100 [Flavobacteriales bacterium]|nr:MAG: hypothetical protein CSA38_01100 [Flavobacteriales bacterium]